MNYEILNKLKKVDGVIRVGNDNIINLIDLYHLYEKYIFIVRADTPLEYELFIYYLIKLLGYKVEDKQIIITIDNLKDAKLRNLFIKIHDIGYNYKFNEYCEKIREMERETIKYFGNVYES
ncbi:hypothetical protein STFE110948_02845 [Streptobacillus felis]|uniref:hypothetical protein n=1 Tax=Streptobacillus felis TaxID=1384509 RepID=UPI00082AD5A2|nr:hypothetical protein [Streptobacillus felis]